LDSRRNWRSNTHSLCQQNIEAFMVFIDMPTAASRMLGTSAKMKKISLEVHWESTFGSVKQAIEDREGISMHQQDLFYAGSRMHDDDTFGGPNFLPIARSFPAATPTLVLECARQ